MHRVVISFPFLLGCPTTPPSASEFCERDESVVLTENDVLPGWGTSIASHPLMTGSPFNGTVTWAADGTTTEATITTLFRDVVIVGSTHTSKPDHTCPPKIDFSMDLTLQTADGALDETLVANLSTPTWIEKNGTLYVAAVNDGIEGSLRNDYVNDPRGDCHIDLRLFHPARASVPTFGEVSLSFDVPEDEPGIGEILGDISFP